MKKFENFKAALVNLNDIFSYKEPYGNVEIAGMVGLYEICFEQSWKAMKELLENFGYACATLFLETNASSHNSSSLIIPAL